MIKSELAESKILNWGKNSSWWINLRGRRRVTALNSSCKTNAMWHSFFMSLASDREVSVYKYDIGGQANIPSANSNLPEQSTMSMRKGLPLLWSASVRNNSKVYMKRAWHRTVVPINLSLVFSPEEACSKSHLEVKFGFSFALEYKSMLLKVELHFM